LFIFSPPVWLIIQEKLTVIVAKDKAVSKTACLHVYFLGWILKSDGVLRAVE